MKRSPRKPPKPPEFLDGLSLSQRGLILVTVPLLILVTLIAVLLIFLVQIQDAAARESRSKTLLYQSQIMFAELGAGVGDLMRALSHTDGLEQANVDYQLQMSKKVDSFSQLCRESHYSQAQLTELKSATSELLEMAYTLKANLGVVKDYRKSKPKMALDKKVLVVSGRVFDILDNIRAYEKKHLLEEQARIEHLQGVILFTLIVGTAATLVISAVLAWLYAVGIKAPLSTIENNSRLLSLRLPLDEPMSGSNELARLDQLLHAVDQEVEQALERERSLFDNAAELICSLEADGTFCLVSPHSTRMLGYSFAELEGNSLLHITAVDQRLHADQELERTRNHTGNTEFELRLKRRDGSEIDTRWTAFWSPEDRKTFCVAHDISEQKEVARMKEEFLSIVSGRLKEPLIAMQSSMSRVAAHDGLPARESQEIARIEKNIDLLVELINDLLDFQRLSGGNLELKLEQCDLKNVIADACDLVTSTAQAKNVSFSYEEGTFIVTADSVKIRQALLNLLSNAVRFAPEGTTVSIKLEAAAPLADVLKNQSGDSSIKYVELSVSDSGPGVPADYRERVFEAFAQAPAVIDKPGAMVEPGALGAFAAAAAAGGLTGTPGAKGSGLGLSICKNIVEAHGGSVGVRDNQPHGSTFFMLIPVEPSAHVQSF